MSVYVGCVISSSVYPLQLIHPIWKLISTSMTMQLVNSFITSRIDYCNSVMIGLPGCSLKWFQSVLNCVVPLMWLFYSVTNCTGCVTMRKCILSAVCWWYSMHCMNLNHCTLLTSAKVLQMYQVIQQAAQQFIISWSIYQEPLNLVLIYSRWSVLLHGTCCQRTINIWGHFQNPIKDISFCEVFWSEFTFLEYPHLWPCPRIMALYKLHQYYYYHYYYYYWFLNNIITTIVNIIIIIVITSVAGCSHFNDYL